MFILLTTLTKWSWWEILKFRPDGYRPSALPLSYTRFENWPIPDLLRTTLSAIAAYSQDIGKWFAAQVAISCNVFPIGQKRLERPDFYQLHFCILCWLPCTNVLVDEYPSMTAKVVGRVEVESTASWSQTKRLTPRLTSVYKMAHTVGLEPT